MDTPALYLITGIMASGKSTVGQLLAERLEKSVHVRGDVFRKMIVSGREEMAAEASAEAFKQLRLRYQLAASSAETYFTAGFSVVLQDVIIGPMLNEMLQLISARPLYLTVLCPDAAEVARREARRGKTGYGRFAIEQLNRVLHEETEKRGLWLDSTRLTAEETVDEILRRAPLEGKIL
ncbi:MAG TPA: AAA family ATPase [Bacillales bacterium]|nr:AAA family ATPase [Bacillales bacterium]